MRHETLAVTAPFAMPPIQVPVFPARDFTITDFGASESDQARNTEALRRAIAECHEAGGGRVVVPAGTWPVGAIHLKSHVNLHLSKGAVLLFSDDPKDYRPAVRSSWEGWECFNYSPLIYAFECENVAVTGEGRLEAKLDGWMGWMSRPPAHMDALKRLYTMGSTGVPVEQRQMAEGDNNLRPHFIQFNRCRNVLVEGVSIRNSPFWTLHLLLCDSVVVRRVDFFGHEHNNDGIDPEGSRNVLIEGCRFDQSDDAIAIKSGRNHDGWRLGAPSENIVIRHCVVAQAQQLAAIGSELSGGVRNVHVHDCRVDTRATDFKPFNLLFIKTNRRRGGFVENITMEDIDASNATVRLSVVGIDADVLYQWRKLVPTYEERLTPIRDITVRNITIGETATPFHILGDPELPVKNVVIDNIRIATARGQKNRYKHVENLRETGVVIDTFVEEPFVENPNK